MRLRSEIWVQAYMRRIRAAGAAGYVMRRGDPHAGAILICVSSPTGTVLFTPAPNPGLDQTDRRWRRRIAQALQETPDIAARLEREASIDPDIWVLEIEDRDGRHFLEDELVDG
jgi:hypothetical protein